MAKKVLIILADGFEEIEAVTCIDVLRRSGLNVVTAGLGSEEISGAHGIRIKADAVFEKYQEIPDAVVLPGGMPGSENLGKSPAVKSLLEKMNKSEKIIGAICAAPAMALAPHGILKGRKATCYPGFEEKFENGTVFSRDRVVQDRHIITSQGPGSAFEFALAIVSSLLSPAAAEKLSGQMLVKT